jgi:hypothetical protein
MIIQLILYLLFLVGWQGDKVLNLLSHMDLDNLLWNIYHLVVLCKFNSTMPRTTCLAKALLQKACLLD